ncbi:MAG TPA: DUF4126 family protein [Vicinamibacterales bacterium]|nr:DUF4126 family protein [Vicinamibacterales bacterium]
MRELARSAVIGALSGSRSMLAPAVVAQSVLPFPARTLLTLMSAGEIVADKTPTIPARTDTLPLTGRLVLGAAAAAGATKRHRMQAAVMGAAGALAATYALFHLRRIATTRLRIPNVVAGMLEDGVALGAAAMLMRTTR